MNELKFKISSALKDIIGRDLISDDLIAVFELVKNSYDAHATKVDIIFENIYSSNSKIIIKDNGKGMSLKDLEEKWLFVAYSAKKEGTEDDAEDYRNNIYSKKPYAGAKGIGRFSCDKLGSTLMLETTKDSKTEVLKTDWEKFEGDLKDEFINIAVEHSSKSKSDFGLKHGTVLEIGNLRSQWNRAQLLKLKKSLAKLINPLNDDKEKFQINLSVIEELDEDKKNSSLFDQVNGNISNSIFEVISKKTTKIEAIVSNEGKYIETTLTDNGKLVYSIKENNTIDVLPNTKISLYYLNQSAKATFARRMGLPFNQYGHVFVYKNNFRVYPYGEPGEDPLKLDTRKAQGYGRYLGTRELFGQVQITDINEILKETSSRGDGFKRDVALIELESFIFSTIRKLEKYVVEVQKWGFTLDNQDYELDERLMNLVTQISGSTEIIELKVDDDFLDRIEHAQEKSVEGVVKNLHEIAQRSKNEDLLEQSNIISRKLKDLQDARKSAEKEVDEVKVEVKTAKKDLIQKETENLFLKSVKSQDFDEIVSFLHHVGISAINIDNSLKLLIKRISKGITISNDEIVSSVKKILIENQKILSISKFASKANFKLYTASIEVNVVDYIVEYIQNILGLVEGQKPNIHVDNTSKLNFTRSIKPIEINIIIDNLISNSRRANAENIYINFELLKDYLEIKFVDDGKGIDEKIANNIFDFGFTTTSGSGIGLYSIKNLIKGIGGEIILNTQNKKRTEFIIKIKKDENN